MGIAFLIHDSVFDILLFLFPHLSSSSVVLVLDSRRPSNPASMTKAEDDYENTSPNKPPVACASSYASQSVSPDPRRLVPQVRKFKKQRKELGI